MDHLWWHKYTLDHWENLICRNTSPKTNVRLRKENLKKFKVRNFLSKSEFFFYFDHVVFKLHTAPRILDRHTDSCILLQIE